MPQCTCATKEVSPPQPQPQPQQVPLSTPPEVLARLTVALWSRDVDTARELLLTETVSSAKIPTGVQDVCPACGGSNLKSAADATDSEEAKGADEAPPSPLRRCPFDIHRWSTRSGGSLLRYAAHNWEFYSALPRLSCYAAAASAAVPPTDAPAAQPSAASTPPSVQLLELLVGYCGANIRERCQDGSSAVHGACLDGDVESVRFFVEACGVGVNGEGLYPLLSSHEVRSDGIGWLGRITRSLANLVFSDGVRGASHPTNIVWRPVEPLVGNVAKPSPIFLASHDESLPTLTYLLSQGCHVAPVVDVLPANEKERAADLVDSLDRRPIFSIATGGPLIASASSSSISAVPREALAWSLSKSTVAVAPSGTMGAAYNPLHAAAIALAPIALQRIIDAGADVLALDEEGRTALEALDDRFAIRCFADYPAEAVEADGAAAIPSQQPHDTILTPTPTQRLVRSILINEGCNVRRSRTLRVRP